MLSKCNADWFSNERGLLTLTALLLKDPISSSASVYRKSLHIHNKWSTTSVINALSLYIYIYI